METASYRPDTCKGGQESQYMSPFHILYRARVYPATLSIPAFTIVFLKFVLQMLKNVVPATFSVPASSVADVVVVAAVAVALSAYTMA